MTILLKDMGHAVISGTTSIPANPGYTSTSVDNVSGVNLNGEFSTIQPDGSVFFDRVNAPQGVYPATATEYSLAANALFPITYGQSAAWQKTQMENLGRSSGFGSPIYIYLAGHYMGMWNGEAGIGFYIFVKYPAGSYPIQEIYYNPVTTLYSLTPVDYYKPTGVSETDPTVDQAQITPEDLLDADMYGSDFTDLTMADGYETPYLDPNSGLPTKISISLGNGRYFVVPVGSTSGTFTTTTTMPATDGSTGYIDIPYSYIVEALNKGWNSWARSIDPLAEGKYLIFSIMAGVNASQLAIGPKGKEGQGINTFSHSLIIDSEGIKVYENAVQITTLKLAQVAESLLRIYRHSDNTIHYVVTTGTETIVHESALACPYPLVVPLYVYGHLYTSGDKVLSADFESGEIHYGSV